jgi:hypothetical protein
MSTGVELGRLKTDCGRFGAARETCPALLLDDRFLETCGHGTGDVVVDSSLAIG